GKFQPELPFGTSLASLPKPSRNLLLQHLQGYRWIASSRLTNQEMDMLRHYDESQEQKILFATHLIEDFHEAISRARGPQQRPPPVTTKCHEVQIASAVITFERVAHCSVKTLTLE